MLRLVVDTNIWIRILLGGRLTLPVLSLWQQEHFQLISRTGDADFRADDSLRQAMQVYGVELWGIQSLFDRLDS